MMRGATSMPAFLAWPAIAFAVRLAFFAPKPSSARPSATEMRARPRLDHRDRHVRAGGVEHACHSEFSANQSVHVSTRL
jgi:hypothetical protein